MPACPTCGTALKTVRQREGLYYSCEGCGGRAVTVPHVRTIAGDRFSVGLLRKINTTRTFGQRPCPFCSRQMLQFVIENPPLQLDACRSCNLVWFDAQEFEAIPEKPLESVNEMHLRVAEAVALHKIEQMKEQEGLEGEPDESWKTIPALFGFPVK